MQGPQKAKGKACLQKDFSCPKRVALRLVPSVHTWHSSVCFPCWRNLNSFAWRREAAGAASMCSQSDTALRVWLPAGIRPLLWAETPQQWREPASVACVNAVLVTKINTHHAIYSWLQTMLTAGNRPVFFVASQSRCGLQVVWWVGKLFGGMPTNMKGIKTLFQQLELVWVLCDETSRGRKQAVRSFPEEKGKENACLGIGKWSEQSINRLSLIGHEFGHKYKLCIAWFWGRRDGQELPKSRI